MSEARCEKSEVRGQKGPTADYADGRRSSYHFTTRGMGVRTFGLEWSLALGAWTLTATCRPVTAAKVGTTSRAPQVAVETAVEVPLQIPLRIAPQISLRVAIRIGPKVGFPIAARIRPQIAFRKDSHVAVQTTSRTAEKTHPQTAARAPVETTPGTVLRTVRTVVAGMSI